MLVRAEGGVARNSFITCGFPEPDMLQQYTSISIIHHAICIITAPICF
jgi:hypothetical protein